MVLKSLSLFVLGLGVYLGYLLVNHTGFCWDPYLPCSDCFQAFAGKHVVITGASRGIGKELALVLGKYGAKLTLTARSAKSLQQVAAECGNTTLVVPGDIGDPAFPAKLVKESVDKHGSKIDLLVVNHALIPYELFQEKTTSQRLEEEYISVFNVNLLGSIRLIHSAMPHLQLGETPKILAISTLGVYFSGPIGLSAYAASKAGFQTFMESVALEFELTQNPIKTTIVHLGEIGTEQLLEMRTESDFLTLTPQRAVDYLVCSAHRPVKDAFVPLTSYALEWFGIISRPFHSLIAYYGYLLDRPALLDKVNHFIKQNS